MFNFVKKLFEHWQAVLCIVFLSAVLYYAGDDLSEATVAFALPMAMGVAYIIWVILTSAGKGEDGEKDDLMTRLGAFWMKLTMPKKKEGAPKKPKG